MRKTNSQSEYRTKTKKRASLAQFFVGLPFELDEGLYEDEKELEDLDFADN